MATAAQIQANSRNAILSTGPKTEAGKRASSQNARKYSFASVAGNQPELAALEAGLREAIRPQGILEEDVLLQIRDAIWRLRKIREEIHSHYAGVEPYNDEAHARHAHALTRYRAAAEMQFFKAIEELRTLQTGRLITLLYLTKEEAARIPLLARPALYRPRRVLPPRTANLQNEPNPPPL